jgi:protein-arginine kinase activator protein McsA
MTHEQARGPGGKFQSGRDPHDPLEAGELLDELLELEELIEAALEHHDWEQAASLARAHRELKAFFTRLEEPDGE